jgi:hypothetical protein
MAETKHMLSMERWIEMYGGQHLIDHFNLEVVPCGDDCDDTVCHGWKVVRKEEVV